MVEFVAQVVVAIMVCVTISRAMMKVFVEPREPFVNGTGNVYNVNNVM